MKLVFAITLLMSFSSLMLGQEEHPSTHQREWEFYRDHPEAAVPAPVRPFAKRSDLMKVQSLNKVVYGFHPYWQNGSETNYYFSLLTHVAYFSGAVDAATGNFTSTNSWSSASVVTLAKQYGVKVHFCITLFSSHSTLFASTTAKNNLIANVMTQINLRGADGCNVDFEAVGSSQATAYKDFLKQLGDTLKAHGKELVVELYAVDWNGIFPSSFFTALDGVVDYYFIMLYDYWYSGSTTAGPSAPLLATNSTSYYHVLRSIKTYLALGCPAGKIIAGFPNYGNDWPTSSSARLAATTATSSSRTYTVIKNNYIDTIAAGNQFFDATFSTPWYRYISGGTWRQVWYDDSVSWSRKFDSILVKGVAGTGMWALGYDGSEPDLWGAIREAFASTPDAANTTFDDFERSVGRFDKYPRWSGSTSGIDIASSQSWSNDQANNGQGSQMVVLKDSAEVSNSWVVRLLSGGGSRANNVQFAKSGYIGFWMKTSTAPSGAQVALTIDDQRNGSTDRTELSSKQSVQNDGQWHLYQWALPGSGWTSFANGNGTLDSTTLSLDAIMLYAPNSASDWTMYIDDVSHNTTTGLPVELVTFTAASENNGIVLQWKTASETNNYGFSVERRSVHGEWTEIGFVSGHGTDAQPHAYQFRDITARGPVAYRLRQIDRNGDYRFSAIIEHSAFAAPVRTEIFPNFPNPFNPSTTISFTVAAQTPTTLIVYDALGRTVAQLVNESLAPGIVHERTFNASHLASGVYYARLVNGSHTDIRRMLLVK